MANTESMVFFALIFSLCASSITIAWIANDYAEVPPCTFGSECAPIELFPSINNVLGSDKNEKYTNSSFDHNLTYPMDDALHGYGTWTQDATGYHLTQTGSLFGGDPILLLNGIVPESNVYTVTYVIDNTPNGEFYITPRRTLANAQTEIDIRLVFASDGIHIKDYPVGLFGAGDLFFISYPQAQDTKTGGSTFEVIFNEALNQVTVWKDGVSLFAQTGLPDEGVIVGEKEETQRGIGLYYGGVGSREVGFTVISTDAKRSTAINAIGDPADVEGWWWKGITDVVDSVIPGAGGVLEMLALIARVIVWTLPEEIFPLWLNLLLIKTQGIALLYMGARLARGGG